LSLILVRFNQEDRYRYASALNIQSVPLLSFDLIFDQVISVHSPLGVDPGLSVPNCQAFTQVFVKPVFRIPIGFSADPDPNYAL
jgi:hypothetical protein